MASLERALTKSLLSTMSEDSVQARREDVLSTPNPARRGAVLALHNLAVRQPRLVAQILGLPYFKHDWEYLGSGIDSTVFRVSEGEVLKVNRKSADSNASERHEFVGTRQQEHEKLVAGLGHFVIPHTSMQVGPHPVVPSVEIVEIRQPYVEISDPKLLFPATLESVVEKISDLNTRQIGIGEQLNEYIERSRSLYSRHGLLPDVCGTANLVLVGGSELRQVDAVPISDSHPDTQASIHGYLNMMEAAIQLAA